MGGANLANMSPPINPAHQHPASLSFNLPLSMLSPTETPYHIAARLICMNVKWAKSVQAFVALPLKDQLILIEGSWRELFVLGAAQFSLPVDFGPKLLSDYDSDTDSTGQTQQLLLLIRKTNSLISIIISFARNLQRRQSERATPYHDAN